MQNAFNWMVAWLIILLVLFAAAGTRAGNKVIYYIAWLAVVFLVVSNYRQIVELITAGNITPSEALS